MIDTMTSFHIVDNVICTSVEKRTYPHKHYVYCLNVRWSDGVQSAIYRKYSSFFDFQTQLRDELKTREDLTVPELPALRLFERENRVGKDTAEKRRKKIEDFCRQALSLPPEIICKPSVTSFFEQWPTDEPRDVNEPPKEGQNTHGLATKILKLFEDNKLQKKFTSLTKGISVDKQHKRSSSTGNVIESSAHWHLAHGPGGSSVLSDQKSCRGSADQLNDPSLKPSSRRGSDSEIIDGQYKVISDYNQRTPNELTLKEGDIVEVVDKLISGWWLVQVADANNGGSIKQGWAPGSCLEPVGAVGQTEISLIVTEAPHQGIGSLFKALNDCTAQDEDEVSYTKGQEVVVLETNMDGWWLVQVNGRQGLTPAANLEQVIDEDEEGDDLYDHIRFMKTSQREYQLYKKAPPPRRSSTLRKTKPLVNIRNSDMDDYAEIGDFSDLGEEKSEASISSAPKPPYVKAHSVSDPTRPLRQMGSIDAGDTTNAIYAQIDKTKKTNNELKKGGLVKTTGTSGHSMNCDHVVSGGPRPTIPERQYSQSELRNDRSATEVEKEAEAQRTAGLQYVNVEIGSKTASYSRHPTTVAYAEITPGLTVPKMPSEMRTPAPTPVNVKPFNIRSEVSNSPPTSRRVNEKPLKPGKKKNNNDRSQPWYVGHMSRQNSEDFLKKHARQNEFLVRESFKKPGDFTISVFHNQRVRHFRIEQTPEGQFLIGKHNFLRVKDVVKTYQQQPLFVDDNDIGVLLTNPVSTASLRLPVV